VSALLPMLILAAVIPPGHEPEIGAMFRDLPLGHGCRVDAIRVRAERIEAPLSCEGGLTPTIELGPAEAAAEAMRTAHYGVHLRGEAPEGLAAEVVALLRPRDVTDVWIWSGPKPAPPAPTLPSPAKALGWALVGLWPLVELVRARRSARAGVTSRG
jgi:hypothetical protein